jgi:putative membrane protein
VSEAPAGAGVIQVVEGRNEGSFRPIPLVLSAAVLLAVLASSLGPWRTVFTSFAVEHLLLTLVGPLLLASAVTPAGARRIAAKGGVQRLAYSLRRPWRGFALLHAVVAVALLPPVLEAAFASPLLWILHRIAIFKAGFFFWWAIAAPSGDESRLQPPMQVLYAFLSTVPTSFVAVILARAGDPIFDVFTGGPALLGVTPHQDQMLGALVMWIPALFFYFGVITRSFWRWQKEDGER